MDRIDTKEINQQVDILSLVGTDLKRVASTGGGEWAGPCPICGGKDRFRVQPREKRWLCRHCTDGKWQDAIDLGRRLWPGESFRSVCERLAGRADLPPAQPRPAADPIPTPSDPPPAAWQERGQAFVTYCERQLWGDPGARDKVYQVGDDLLTPLDYLAWRGLRPETIKAFRLGYNPAWIDDKPETWGLPGADPVKLAPGIVMPAFVGGDLWYLKTRLYKTGRSKYTQVTGGKPALYNADWLPGADLVLLVEGELDCMLAHQELNDVVGVATFGSASKRLDVTTWGSYLLPARAILTAYDQDQAGEAGAGALADLTKRARIVQVPKLRPGDKDITDYYQAGGDLWEWARYNLDRLDLLPALGVPVGGELGAASA